MAHFRATPPKPPDRTTSDRRNIRWKLPPWPNLKVNFDGSIFRDGKQAGVGVIIRDWNGKVVASIAEVFPLPFSVTTVEVLVASKVLKLARDLGLSSIVLEGDSKTTIDALLCESPSLTDYGNLIDEAKELAKEFMNIEFSHVLRQGNSATHNIARHTRHVSKY